MYDIEGIRSNPHYKITMVLPTGTLEAYMVDDTFNISGSSEFVSASEAIEGAVSSTGLGGKLLNAREASQGMVSATTGNSLRHVKQTLMNYQGSTKPQFTIGLHLVAVAVGDDPRAYVKQLMEGVSPERGTGDTLSAPWGYKAIVGGDGRFSITIGSWFQAFNLVLTEVAFDLSREVVTTDVPLYTTGSISFEPDQALFADEIIGLFPGLSEAAVSSGSYDSDLSYIA